MKRILITGAAGFIGHHVIEHFLKNTDFELVAFDKLSNVSPGWDRVRDIESVPAALDSGRLKLVSGDFRLPVEPGVRQELGAVTHILHLGAESHVDTSIKDPMSHVEGSVVGTLNMLEYARTLQNFELFLYFSTDEVFGPAPAGVYYREGDRHNPSNPYAAMKAAAEDMCVAYANTHKLPIVITNTMNVFGERQHPEKFIPKVMQKILKGEQVTIHGDAAGNSGSRFWIHARNVADALLYIVLGTGYYPQLLKISNPSSGRFNIVGEREITTLDLANMIANKLGKTLFFEVVDAAAERPGHDFRYAMDGAKLVGMGWRHPKSLDESLDKTLNWMLAPENAKWLEIK